MLAVFVAHLSEEMLCAASARCRSLLVRWLSDFLIKTPDQDRRGGHNYGGSVLEQLDKEGRGGHNT